MDYIIATEQLTKKYKNFTSVNNVSIHVRRGSIYGFLEIGRASCRERVLRLV